MKWHCNCEKKRLSSSQFGKKTFSSVLQLLLNNPCTDQTGLRTRALALDAPLADVEAEPVEAKADQFFCFEIYQSSIKLTSLLINITNVSFIEW